MEQPERSAVLSEIDKTQARLRQLLRSAEPARLARRPLSGAWSAMENVRHLLFAEQAHLGRFLPAGSPLRALGRPRALPGQTRVSAVGGGEGEDLGDVLAAWSKLHRAVRVRFYQPDADMLRALEKNLKHLNAHVKMIERLLP